MSEFQPTLPTEELTSITAGPTPFLGCFLNCRNIAIALTDQRSMHYEKAPPLQRVAAVIGGVTAVVYAVGKNFTTKIPMIRSNESEMALFFECMYSVLKKSLPPPDIVRMAIMVWSAVSQPE
jgi:hypothetical protein